MTLFETDLRLRAATGALDLTVTETRGRDLALAAGADNITQALTLRLLVRRGELAPLGWPDYGSRIHELIGQPGNARTRALLLSHARTAVEQDPRVAEVRDIRISAGGGRDTVRVEIDVRLIDEPARLNLVVDLPMGTA